MTKRKNLKTSLHIGNVLDVVLKNIRRSSNQEMLQIWDLWEDIAGDAVAANARPAAFKGKVLLVHVSSSPWIHQLQFLKKELIAKCNEAAGQDLVEEIKFKIGPLLKE